MHWKESDAEWIFWARLAVKAALVIGALYVGYHFYERNRIANMGREPAVRKVELPADLFSFVPKSYVTDLESARRKLVGKPLWVKEGYRWSYEPGGTLFRPIERIVPTAFATRGGEAVLLFQKDGNDASFPIGTPERVYVDDIFFVKDPREIYDHWTDEMWTEAASGAIDVGMSEIQIGLTLGVGEVARQSPGGTTRVVDYKQCRLAGLEPVRVTFRHHVAVGIEPLDL